MSARIRRLITSLFYRLTSSHYRLVLESGLFDKDYYLRKNPDVAASGLDPLAHYLTQGFKENRRPGALFDSDFYLSQTRGRTEGIENPLIHYLEHDRALGYRANVFVDKDYYQLTNSEYDDSLTDPLSHFLDRNETPPCGCSPSPYFDAHFYCATYADSRQFASDPRAAYLHFLHTGAEENRQPSSYFDPAYYVDNNPKLAELGLDPFSHYGTYGAGERKSPSPLFDPDFYATTYGIAGSDDIFAHFLRKSVQEDLQPCSWFDPKFYRARYLDDAPKSIPPLKHFLEEGVKTQLYPNRRVALLEKKPLLSILVPVYNVKQSYLNNCIRSVLYQSYPHWELCLVDDCSTDPALRPLLERWAAADPRIKLSFLEVNAGISAATNTAASLASGSYLIFLDNDDELSLDALQTFTTWINEYPADLYYCDEDLIGDDGRQFSIFRKPGFSRELLLCHNYVTHCVCTKKTLFEKVGGCSEEIDGAQDLDLFLKLSEASERIMHIPRVLYHWRAAATSTSINHDEKQYADEAGRIAVQNALARSGPKGDARCTDLKFFYRVVRHIQKDLLVTLVIDWERDQDTIAEWLKDVLGSAGYSVAQLILLLPYQAKDELTASLSRATGINVLCMEMPTHLGRPAKLEAARSTITTDLVAFISGELRFKSTNWLSALVEYGQFPEYGIVSGRVDYPADYYRAVHPMPDYRSVSPVYYKEFLANASVFMNGRHCSQQILAAGTDLFLMRNEFLQHADANHLSDYPYLFGLADCAFRLHQKGKKNIYTPYCRAATDNDEITRSQRWPLNELQEEKLGFQSMWYQFLEQGDPFYSLGLITDEGLSVTEFKSWMTGAKPLDFVEDSAFKRFPTTFDSQQLAVTLQV